MTLSRRDLITKLRTWASELSQLAEELEAMPSPAAAKNQNVCSIHNVPWRKTQYGLGHPLNDGSGKWCNKARTNTRRAG